MILAIIGTAGRGTDRDKLTLKHWWKMLEVGRTISEKYHAVEFVSGGAAWADHVAVVLSEFLHTPLTLYLPGLADDIETSKKHHYRFSQVIGYDSLQELNKVSDFFGNTIIRKGGFKDRNRDVAKHATHYLAMTFGDGPNLKDGGTAHTVSLMKHKPGMHLDLHTFNLYSL